MTTVVVNGQTVTLTTSQGGDWFINAGGTLIVSAGGIAGDNTALIANSGTVKGGAANGSAGFLVSGATISNSGTMEASGSNALLDTFGATITNHKLMQAIATGVGGFAELNVSGAVNNSGGTFFAGAAGSGAQAFVNLSGTVDNSGGKIIASGVSGQATIDIDFGVISGGTVGGIGGGAKVGVFGPTGSGAILDAVILSGTFIGDAGQLLLSGDTLGAKNKIEAFDGGTALLSNVTLGAADTFMADRNGNLFLRNNGAVNFGAGTTVQALGTSGASGFIGVSASSIGNLGNVQALASGAHTSAQVDLFGSGGITNGATIASIANGFAGTFAVVSALTSGSFVNSGTVVASGVNNNATGNDGSDAGVVVSAGSNVSNTKTMEALGNSNGSAFLDIYASGSISNGAAGLIMASAANESVARMFISAGGTLTNLGVMKTIANNSYASGRVVADTIVNKNTMAASATNNGEAYLALSAGVISNSGGTIQASAGAGSFAEVYMGGTTVSNFGGKILATATGNGSAFVALNNDNVFGGTLQTIGSAAIGVDSGSASVQSASILANSKILAIDGSLFLGNDTIGSGSTAEALNGGKLFLSGTTTVAPFTFMAVTSNTSFTATSAFAFYQSNAVHGGGPAAALVTSSFDGFAEIGLHALGVFTNRAPIEAIVTSGEFGSAFAFVSGGSGVVNSSNIEALVSANYQGSSFAVVEGGGFGVTNAAGATIQAVVNSSYRGSSFTAIGGEVVTNALGAVIQAVTSNSESGSAGVGVESFNTVNAGTMAAIVTNSYRGSSFVQVLAENSATNTGLFEAVATGMGSASAEMEGSSVINSGTVLASAGGTGDLTSAFASLSAFGGGTVTNNNTLKAIATGGFAEVAVEVGSGVFNNNKTMLAQATSGAAAENFIHASGGTVNNNAAGTITASASGSGTEAFTFISAGFGGEVNNSGTVTASATGSDSEAFTSVYAFSGFINNYKTIQAIATSGGSAFVELTAGGDGIFSNGEIYNASKIVASATSASTAYADVSAAFVYNDFGATIGAFANWYSHASVGVSGSAILNSGTIVASANQSSEAELVVSGGSAVVNVGTILVAATKESVVSGYIYANASGFSGGGLFNDGTIKAQADADSHAFIHISAAFVDNTFGTIVASAQAGASGPGQQAQIFFDGASGGMFLSGGSLQTIGSGAELVVDDVNDQFQSTTIVSSSFLLVTDTGTLTMSGDTVGTGAVVEALSGGIVDVSGSLANSGTLFASSGGSVFVAVSAGVVGPGNAAIGKGGIVELGGTGDQQGVVFNSGATSGGLILDAFDGTSNTRNSYTGKISGFGGANHTDTTEFIELANVQSDSNMSITYSGSLTEGILTVLSGGTAIANLDLVGNYTNANFHLSADGAGDLIITDPPINGGAVTNGALLGSYMASMFPTTATQMGAPTTDQTQQQGHLTLPHA